jgi:hypothetical protein
MDDGVVVVSYEASKLSILPRCHVAGSYGPVRTLPARRQTHQSAYDVAASVGGPGLRAGGSVQDVVGVQYVVAGRREASFGASVETGNLVGECRGATHVVAGAFVGAVGTVGMSRRSGGLEAGLMGISLDGRAAGARVSSTDSADFSACDDPARRRGACSTPIQLSLRKIVATPVLVWKLSHYQISTARPDGLGWTPTGLADWNLVGQSGNRAAKTRLGNAFQGAPGADVLASAPGDNVTFVLGDVGRVTYAGGARPGMKVPLDVLDDQRGTRMATLWFEVEGARLAPPER